MASKLYFHDIDLQKVSILKDALMNPLSTGSRTTLGGTLGAPNAGLSVWDTDLSRLFVWDGSAWVDVGAGTAGAMFYAGAHSDLVNPPGGSADGYAYVMTAAGTLTWAGMTFAPSAVVEVGDMVVRRNSTTWDIYEGNTVSASEIAEGTIEIATQAETNTGTDDVRAVTPLKITSWASTRAFAKTYFVSGQTTVANTPLTITHNLALQNKDSFVISVKDSGGSEVGVDVDSVGVNSLTITTGVAATNLTVTVIGF